MQTMAYLLTLWIIVETVTLACGWSRPTPNTLPCGPCQCRGTAVDCSSLSLTTVPHNGLPPTTTTLTLHNNSISFLPPRVFSTWTNLTWLDLSNNLINNITNGAFGDLQNLQWLSLTNNRLALEDNAYPKGVFALLSSSLLHLHIEGNCKAMKPGGNPTYPAALAELTQLQSLHVDGLPDAILHSGFAQLRNLQNLSLSGVGAGICYLHTLTNQTFMHFNSSSLRILNISACNISHIELDAFRPLRDSLVILDLSLNTALGFDTLGQGLYGLQNSSLRELHVNSIVHPFAMFVTVTAENTHYFKNTSLNKIYAMNNRLEVFCKGALSNMPHTLSYVNLNGNRLSFGSYIRELGNLTNLKQLELNGHETAFNPPSHFPTDALTQCGTMPESVPCNAAVSSRSRLGHPFWFEEAQQDSHFFTTGLSEEAKVKSKRVTFVLPPKLYAIRASFNQLFYRLHNVHFHPNNSLHELDFDNNLLSEWIGGISGLRKLKRLNLYNNQAKKFNFNFLKSFPSLTYLKVNRNYLRDFLGNDTEGNFFAPASELEDLVMSRNYLNKLPVKIFRGMNNLKRLILTDNVIDEFNITIEHMHHLELVNLSYNGIHFLTQFVMDQLDNIAVNNSITVDLSFNPIACTCQHIDFLTWIYDSKVNFTNKEYYACMMSDGSVQNMTDILHAISSLKSTCADKSMALVGAGTGLICLISGLLVSLAYRYRWKLRYLYYASRLAYRRVQTSGNDDFTYDAFVSYSSEDNDFVHNQLIDQLETQAGLRLNVHNRDFTPGRPIQSNIVDAIQSSRCTLVVLSRELLKSEWCHYEMQMATMEAAHTGRDVLLFLLYEDVPSHDIPRDVLYNLQASTYITFPTQAEPSLIHDFWARLAQAIRQ